MAHRPRPRWWRGAHCAFYDADFLERVAVCRARSQAALTRHEATRSSQAGGCISPGFQDVVPPLSDDDVSSASPTTTLPSPTSFFVRRRNGR